MGAPRDGQTGVTSLVAAAWTDRRRAPELAMVLSRHTAAMTMDPAARAGATAVRAAAGFRLGHADVDPMEAVSALTAVESSEPSGAPGPQHVRQQAVPVRQLAHVLRVELSGLARSVGLPRSGLSALAPVLSAPETAMATRGAALVRAARCLSAFGWHHELDEALAAADRLYLGDPAIPPDASAALRALQRAVVAASHRRRGHAEQAMEAARDGLRLLRDGERGSADDVCARTRLTLELVSVMLDRGQCAAALRLARPVLDEPIRAAAAAAHARLQLTVAVRVHWNAGELDRCRRMLHETVALASRHRLDSVLIRTYPLLGQLCELSGEPRGATEYARMATAASQAKALSRERTRDVLATAFPPATGTPDELLAELGDCVHRYAPGAESTFRPTTPTSTEPSRMPRHAAGAGGTSAIAVTSGVQVAAGSGGRRRAPESATGSDYPDFAQQWQRPVGGRHSEVRGRAGGAGRLASSPWRPAASGVARHAVPDTYGQHGRHAEPEPPTSPTATIARATAHRPGRPEPDAVPTVPEPGSLPEAPEPDEIPTVPEPDAVPEAPQPDGVPADPEPARRRDPADPETAGVAGQDGIDDLGFADLLTEALVALRRGDAS